MGKKKKLRKAQKEYKSYIDRILDSVGENYLQIWFGNDIEKRKEYGRFLVQQEELNNEALLSSIEGNVYEKKIDKLKYKKMKSFEDTYETLYKIEKYKHKLKKNTKYRNKDLGMAVYMNDKRYAKKFLDKDKYRKHLKDIAKRERKEFKEMKRLGYIHSKDPDVELKKLEKANSIMTKALSDAYTQKHFL
jgi:hypothetical protein